jgi:hypothetical protein
MEDAYLASVVRYVEGGGEPVKVSTVLTSSVVVSGFVRPAASFTTVSRQQAQDQHVRETKLIRQHGETVMDAAARKDAEAKAHAARIQVFSTTPTGRLPKRSRCRTASCWTWLRMTAKAPLRLTMSADDGERRGP